MNTLEREIIEKFHQLDRQAQQRVREIIDQTADYPEFDYAAWFHEVEALRQQIRSNRTAALPPIDVVGLLRDIRDGEDE